MERALVRETLPVPVHPNTQAELAEVIACAHRNWSILPAAAAANSPGVGWSGVELVVSTERLNQVIQHARFDCHGSSAGTLLTSRQFWQRQFSPRSSCPRGSNRALSPQLILVSAATLVASDRCWALPLSERMDKLPKLGASGEKCSRLRLDEATGLVWNARILTVRFGSIHCPASGGSYWHG